MSPVTVEVVGPGPAVQEVLDCLREDAPADVELTSRTSAFAFPLGVPMVEIMVTATVAGIVGGASHRPLRRG
jgi:hypothetical protein